MSKAMTGIVMVLAVFGVGWRQLEPAVESYAPAPVELRDIMQFLGVRAWKLRIQSEGPFNAIDVKLMRHDWRNNAFFAKTLGQMVGEVSLTRRSNEVAMVMWRKEKDMVRFQVGCPGQRLEEFEAPAADFEDFVPVGMDQGGLDIGGDRILAVKWKRDAQGNPTAGHSKTLMEGYMSLQFELRSIKGMGD